MKDELKIISPIAWVLAVVAYISMATVLLSAVATNKDTAHWPGPAQWCFSLGISLIVAVYIVLIGYVCADAQRRGMRCVMWTLLAIFVPNALGIILYFVLRDPLMITCPVCSAQIRHGFAFCPSCGATTSHACPACRKPVDPSWSHCVACGAKL